MARSFVRNRKPAVGARRGKSFNPRVVRENVAFNKASGQIIQLLRRINRWGPNKNGLVADAIIKICSIEGVPVEKIKTRFLRRDTDDKIINALDKRVTQLFGKQKPK